MAENWDEEELRMQERAAAVRAQLELDDELARIGVATLTGSTALRLMVARDVDLTVATPVLTEEVVERIGGLAARLIRRPDVREVLLRNDTGDWNEDARYPDGVYLRILCRDEVGELWKTDVWFVDEPERQPDLEHLRTIAPRITPEIQAVVLSIKRATHGVRPDGTRLPSYEIYRAVLDQDVRTVEDFHRLPRSA